MGVSCYVCPSCGGKKSWNAKRCQKCRKSNPHAVFKKSQRADSYTVVYCPDGTYEKGNMFSKGMFSDGLQCGYAWPTGMRVAQRNVLYTVCEAPSGETFVDEYGEEWPVQVLRRVRNG